MNKILRFLTKYWIILSLCATILTSLITWSMHLKTRIDSDEDVLNDTKQWVQDHDDNIKALHDDVIRLKTLEEARERGLCK